MRFESFPWLAWCSHFKGSSGCGTSWPWHLLRCKVGCALQGPATRCSSHCWLGSLAFGVWGADHLIGPEPFTSEVLPAWGGLCTSRGATWWARAFWPFTALQTVVHAILDSLFGLHWWFCFRAVGPGTRTCCLRGQRGRNFGPRASTWNFRTCHWSLPPSWAIYCCSMTVMCSVSNSSITLSIARHGVILGRRGYASPSAISEFFFCRFGFHFGARLAAGSSTVSDCFALLLLNLVDLSAMVSTSLSHPTRVWQLTVAQLCLGCRCNSVWEKGGSSNPVRRWASLNDPPSWAACSMKTACNTTNIGSRSKSPLSWASNIAALKKAK